MVPARPAQTPTGAVLLAAAAAGVSLVVFVMLGLGGLPSGLTLTPGWRVAHGDLPYRDFWTMYAPGSSLLLGSLFRVFGEHAAVSLVGASLLSAAGVGMAAGLARRIGAPAWQALVVAALVAAALVATGFYAGLGTYPPVLVALLLAHAAGVRGMASDADRARWLAGLAAGGAALFKHDVGAYTALAVGAGVATAALLDPARGRPLAALRAGLQVGLGALAVVAPAAAGVAWLGGADAWEFLIRFPASEFGLARPEAYPGLVPTWVRDPWLARTLVNGGRWFASWWPAAVAIAALAWAVRRRGQPGVAGPAPAVAFAVAFALHWNAAQVQINTHAVSLTLYAALLGAWLRPPRIPAGLVAAGWIGALLAAPLFQIWDQRLVVRERSTLPRISGYRVPADEAAVLAELVPWIQARTRPDERVYVGLMRHDSVIFNKPGLSFVIDRLPATRYHELHPGVADREAVQREMIRDLERRNVAWLVRVQVFPDPLLDDWKRSLGEVLPGTGAGVLDAWLAEHFEPVRAFGQYQVWRRRG